MRAGRVSLFPKAALRPSRADLHARLQGVRPATVSGIPLATTVEARCTVEISRRTFIQSAVAGGAALSAFGFDVTPAYAQAKTLKISRTTETRSTCPYCSVSCGVIIHTLGDKSKNAVPQVVHVEGDPDHPI